MCGIAGILNLAEGPPPEERLLRSMLGMIHHRGPDQFGIYLADQVALGNARLSIIDLGGGQQPITNEDQTLWIVYNGEVFNYVELRSELEAKGHQLTSHTDTEVILHLYEEEGPACLSRLNGQFAMAIWDERKQTLFLARDRLGVRPLFYAQAGGTLVFGSEIKAIFADPRVPRELDTVALDQIFTYWSTLSPRTCFRGVVSLPPGHYLMANASGIKVRTYWEVQFEPRPAGLVEEGGGHMASGSRSDKDLEQYLEEFRHLLLDATRIRLRADVPVGAYLSGGLDSSTIAAMIQKLGCDRLDTFSIAFSDPKFDESEHQRRMARFLGTAHQVVYATQADIGRVFPEVIWHTETPVMRTSPAPMFLLSKLVHDRGYKVVLTGEGADEFLGGYDIFKETLVRRFWARQPESRWRPLLLQKLYPDIAHLAAAGSPFLKAFFGADLTDVDAPCYSHSIRWRNNRRSCRFFSAELSEALANARADGTSDPLTPPQFNCWGPLEKAQYLEISIFLSQYLLSSQGDRPAMAHSVEGRFPFLDYRVVEFCNRLPSGLKLRGLKEKVLLRHFARGLLPPEICQRTKRPYRAPIARSFIHEQTPEYVNEVLDMEQIKQTGLFRPEAVRQMAAKVRQGGSLGETDEMALVGIISTQLTQRMFVREFRAAVPLADKDDVKVVWRHALARA